MITISTFHLGSTRVVDPTVARAGAAPSGIQLIHASFIKPASAMSARNICMRSRVWHTTKLNTPHDKAMLIAPPDAVNLTSAVLHTQGTTKIQAYIKNRIIMHGMQKTKSVFHAAEGGLLDPIYTCGTFGRTICFLSKDLTMFACLLHACL